MSPRNTASKHSNSRNGNKASKTRNTKTPSEPLLSPGMRDDLIGVALAVLGVALFVAVVVPSDAVVTSAVNTGLLHCLGLGSYILPFALVLWGISYFLKTEETRLGRLIAGVSMIVIAIMSLCSLLNPMLVESDPQSLFNEALLMGGGGYVGSGVSWVLLTLFGKPIGIIILVALIIAGLILVGVSISSIFIFGRNLIQEQFNQERQPKKKGKDKDFEPQVRKGQQQQFDYDYDDPAYLPEADETIALGGTGRRSRGMQDQDAAETVAFDSHEEDVPWDDEQDASQTVVLGAKKHGKGAKTTRISKKDKKKAQDSSDQDSTNTVALDGKVQTATEGFELPDARILKTAGKRKRTAISGELKETAALLQQTLEEFNLPARVVGWLAGPTVTMFKVELPSGVKLSKLTGLADDIALSLAASSVRIAQIPNTSLVGVEIPNKTRANVLLGDVLPSAGEGPLQMAIGEDVDGNYVCVDLAKMPHLLIGGTTGSGKSVCINGMIVSLLMRSTPAEVRMIMIDPKRVEFSSYNGIPHLYVPVVTEPKEAAAALRWGVVEMERRLKVFEQVAARNIGQYNQMIQSGKLDTEEGERPAEMPYIVIVIDELSDLMMAAGKDVEDSIVRISQLARAAGIHLIIATQRPSSNVVTGMIKANITNRIALLVATGVDSRVILDQSGAEKLVGNGDMLFNKPEWGKPKRIQGCFVGDAEIEEIVEHLKEQGTPDYHPEILQVKGEGSSGASGGGGADASDDDPLIWEAADAVVHAGLGSTSMLQRRLKVGYARAGRIMDMLEAKGIVGPPDGSRAREVLIDSVEDLEAIKAFEAADREGL